MDLSQWRETMQEMQMKNTRIELLTEALFLCMSELLTIYLTKYGGVENALESSNALRKGMSLIGNKFEERMKDHGYKERINS